MKRVTPFVKKIWATPDPRRAVAVAARVCYTNRPVETLSDSLSEAEIAKSVKAVLDHHHTSTLRHAVYMFAIGGVSRTFSHQLVRHGPGNAYEQRSQHYRTEKDFNFFQPETISGEVAGFYEGAIHDGQTYYDYLLSHGVPKEDAREVLPNAVETTLVWTANLEAVVNFCRARCCRVNTEQIALVAAEVRKIVCADFPELRRHLGPTCWTQGVCFEGEKFFEQCKRPWQSPCVLWDEQFPFNQHLVYLGGGESFVTAPVKPTFGAMPEDVTNVMAPKDGEAA